VLGLSQDERDFLTELAAKRELVTDRARYAEYATAASTGQRPMPVARPATAPAQERGPARPATAPTRGGARFATKSAKTPPRRETHSLRTAFADPRDAHGHALEQADEVARGSAIKPKPIKPNVPNEQNAVRPASRRDELGSPGRDATTTTTTTTTAKPTSSLNNNASAKKKLVKELASHNSAREPELKTGKRERKKTEFLSATLLQSPEKKKHEQDKKVQKEGEGSKLRDIENVKFAMDKMKR
jgi:hypothetical protein